MGLAFLTFFGFGVAVLLGAAPLLEGVVLGSPATCRAVSPPEDEPSLPPPSTRPITKTSRNARPSTSSRRVQYTRAGNGPRGRVTALMRSR